MIGGGSFTGFIFGAISLLVSFILAFLGFEKIENNPEELKGKPIALVVLVLSGLMLAFVALLVIRFEF